MRIKLQAIAIGALCGLSCVLLLAGSADATSTPAPNATSTNSASTKHAFDPCAVISQADVASAAGVAASQVVAGTAPAAGECEWAVASHAGVPGQTILLGYQAVDQAKRQHGHAGLLSVLNAAGSVAGVGVPGISHVFMDAQIIEGLGDRAGWKNGTLSVLKNELLFNVTVGGASNNAGLNVAKTLARTVLERMPAQ